MKSKWFLVVSAILAVMLGLTVAVAGCKTTTTSTTTAAATTAAAETTAVTTAAEITVATAAAGTPVTIGGELKFIGWEGYDALDILKEWYTENSINVNSTYIGNNEEMFTKLKTAGPGTYDIATPYDGAVPTWIENDLLEPIDLSKIPNYEKLYEDFKQMDSIKKDGKVYAVPFTWAPAAILYNADIIKTPPTSYEDLLKPEYKNKLIKMDGMDGAFTMTALMLGYGNPDPHHITLEELEKCKELTKKFTEQALTIAPSYGEMKNILVSGDGIITCLAWAAVAGWAQAEGVNIQVVIPEEGSISYVDVITIPKGAPNIDTAYAFINKMLEPEIQAEFASSLTQLVITPEAVQYLPEEAKWVDYNNIDNIIKKAPTYPPIPEESDEFATYADWLEAWNEVKAGS